MGLLDKFFGDSSSGKRSGGTSLMDRFMNPMTQSGLALLGGNDPAQAAQVANQYQRNKGLQQLASGITDPHERAMLMFAPDAYVNNKMKRPGAGNNWASADGRLYNKATGEWKDDGGGPKKKWSRAEMRKEYKYEGLDPASIEAAEAAGDPSLFQQGGMDYQTQKLTNLGKAQSTVKDVVSPIREGMDGIHAAARLLQVGGGSADYGTIVSFVRATDPGTAAKEGEVSSAIAAEGYFNQIGTLAVQAQKSGGVLTKQHKENLHKAISSLAEMYKERYKEAKEHYTGSYSQEYGINPEHIMGSPINFRLTGEPEFPDDPTLNTALGDLVNKASEFILPGKKDAEQTASSLKPGERGTPENPIIVKRVNGKLVEMP